MLAAYLLAGAIGAAIGFMLPPPDELPSEKGKKVADGQDVESTRVPTATLEDDGDSNDDKETHWSRDSGSTARTNRQKGSGRVRKLQERAAKRREAAGIEEHPKKNTTCAFL